MKKFSFIISLVLSFITGFSAAPKDSLTSSAGPAADAEYISLVKEYTLNQDGSMDYHFIKKLKLDTYRSFQNLYGETFIVYNPVFQKLTINNCYTIMADGKKVNAPLNSMNEVLPAIAAGAPPFNSLREMVVTHTGLERGATINLDYNLRTDKGYALALFGNEILAESEPVKDLTISVRIPQGRELFFRLLNTSLQAVKTTENNFLVYTWHIKDIAAISAEEFQESNYAAYPRLIFSTSGSRNETFALLTEQPSFGLQISEAMRAETEQLKNANPDELSFILKVQEKVIDEIKLWPVSLRYTGYRCREPEETWNTMGGTLSEKAILLAALLRSAGIQAVPVAISRSVFFDEKIGTLSDIEDFVVRVEIKESGIQYLSLTYPNSLNLGQVYGGRIFTRLARNEKPEYARSGDPEEKISMKGTFLVSSDPRLTGELSLQLDGAVNPYLGLVRDKNKMKNLISGGISKPDMKDITISQSTPETAFQTYTVMADKPFRKDSSWFYFNLPVCISGLESWGIKTLSSKRSQPLEVPSAADESYNFSLALSVGLSLFSPVKKIDIKNKAGNYYYELRQEGNKVILSRKIKIREKIILPENYNDFKILMDNWNNPVLKELIFRSGK